MVILAVGANMTIHVNNPYLKSKPAMIKSAQYLLNGLYGQVVPKLAEVDFERKVENVSQ